MPEIDTSQYYRDHLEQVLSGQYVPHGDEKTASCVVGAAFGYRASASGTSPGASNQALAEYVAKYAGSLPLVLQSEIAEAMPPDRRIKMELYPIDHARDGSHRLDTTEFLTQASELMSDRGWSRALIVAHPNHLPWVDYLARQLGIETIVPKGLEAVPFDPESEQYWTRDLKSWQKEVYDRQNAGDARTPARNPSES